MTTTFIDTNKIARTKSPGQGEFAEVLNQALCGAKNVLGMLRWLKAGEKFDAKAQQKFQVLYLMDGKGVINLANKDYEVTKGAGIFLGPSESAVIRATNEGALKLFHIMIPPITK
jgi:mannose-6-phosphate isomerase-like protein (cupin superfamily)